MAVPSNVRYVQGVTQVGADQLNSFVQGSGTVSQLRGFIGVPGMSVHLLGVNAPNDGGAGLFQWNASASGDNGSTIIVPNGVISGAWVRDITPPAKAVYTSQTGNNYALAVTIANALGDVVIVDSACTLATNQTAVPKQVIFQGGSITLGAFNLTMPASIGADQYARIFVQTSTGITSFNEAAELSICWWGADPTNNTNAAAQLLTRQACQAAARSLDAAGQAGSTGGVIWCPPGIYRLDVGAPIVWRHGIWKAKPRTARFDFDPATVPSAAAFPLANGCIFCTGDPTTGNRAGSTTILTGEAAVGTVTPSSVVYGCGWDGPDIISFNTTTLTGTKFLSGLNFLFAQSGCYVRNARFIGLPNDGLNGRNGSATFENLTCWLNGFYGPAQTHNGMSVGGWWDVTNTQLTSRGIQVRGCDLRFNKDEGLQCGMSAQALFTEIVLQGNQDKQIEGDTAIATNISVWLPSQAYVSTGTPSLKYLNGIIYQCTTGGTSAAPGPTGTGTGITDGGGVVWKSVGVMPPEGLIPEDLQFANINMNGAWPTVTYVDGTAVTIVNNRGFARGLSGINIGSGNEGRCVMRNIVLQALGDVTFNAGSGCIGLSCGYSNGGDIDVSGIVLDDIAINSGSNGKAVALGSSLIPGPASGGSPRQTGRIRVNGIQLSQINNAGTAAVFIAGCSRIVDLRAIESDNTAIVRNHIEVQINAHGSATCPVDEVNIEDCYSGGVTNSSVFMSIPGNAVIGNLIVRNSRLLLNNSIANGGEGAIRIQGPNSGLPVFTIAETIIEGVESSYAGLTQFPIICVNVASGSLLTLRAANNKLDTGPFKLTFNGGNPSLINSNVFVANVNITGNQNGIPSQRISYGTATPAAGDWSKGDTQYRTAPSAAGVSYETCTTAGSFGTAYSGITCQTDGATNVAVFNSTTNVNVGQWITIAGTGNGPFRICNINGLSITLNAIPNAAVGPGAAVALSTAVFKSVSLAA